MDRISTHPFTTHPHMSKLAEEEFGGKYPITPHQFLGTAPAIGHDVWIGQGAVIKRGITIGDGSVIGARAFVTKDVPPYAVVVGMPASIKYFRIPEETLRGRLLALRWWDYNYADFPITDPRDINGFVDAFTLSRDAGQIRKLDSTGIDVIEDLKKYLQQVDL